MMQLFVHFQKMKVYKLFHLVLVKGNGMALWVTSYCLQEVQVHHHKSSEEFTASRVSRNLHDLCSYLHFCSTSQPIPSVAVQPSPNQDQNSTHSLFSFCLIIHLQRICISLKGYQNEVWTRIFLMQYFITYVYPNTHGWTSTPVNIFTQTSIYAGPWNSRLQNFT